MRSLRRTLLWASVAGMLFSCSVNESGLTDGGGASTGGATGAAGQSGAAGSVGTAGHGGTTGAGGVIVTGTAGNASSPGSGGIATGGAAGSVAGSAGNGGPGAGGAGDGAGAAGTTGTGGGNPGTGDATGTGGVAGSTSGAAGGGVAGTVGTGGSAGGVSGTAGAPAGSGGMTGVAGMSGGRGGGAGMSGGRGGAGGNGRGGLTGTAGMSGGRGGTNGNPCAGYPSGAKAFVPSDGKTHCYWARSSMQTWAEAQASCTLQSGHLVTILSAEENAFVVSVGQFSSSFNDTWIGATDGKTGTDKNGPGTYKWVTNETWSYSNWQQGQPDGFCDPCTIGQTCTCDHRAVLSNDGTWNDRWQDNMRSSVCEATAN